MKIYLFQILFLSALLFSSDADADFFRDIEKNIRNSVKKIDRDLQKPIRETIKTPSGQSRPPNQPTVNAISGLPEICAKTPTYPPCEFLTK